jgi:hypothetical protein
MADARHARTAHDPLQADPARRALIRHGIGAENVEIQIHGRWATGPVGRTEIYYW